MSEFLHLKEWLRLPDSTKLNIYTETGRQIPLPAVAVEKDWWVVHTLALIFSMECAPSLIFKGGTSLSKAWNLIDRFSEDIDLVLDREFLGFKGELTSGDIRKLRRASYTYLTTTFTEELKAKFSDAGFSEVEIKYREVVNHDQDPIIIEIYYKKLTETETYLKPGLLVEVGSRSLKEPFTQRTFNTLAGQNYADRPFADKAITIPVVNPERTFLEKVFLLHEEFQRPKEKIRVERLSRHLYDVEKLSKTEFAKTALSNADLYTTIVAHRKKFAHISGVDYYKHAPEHINFIPPDDLLPLWEADYKEMQENMIYRESLPFVVLIEKLSELQNLINTTKWDSAPSYKQTEVGLIPVDWEVIKISECSTRITDGEHLTPQRTKSGYFLLSARNILNGKIDVKDVDYVGFEEYQRIRVRCNPEFGDVLISCSGSIGRVATVPKNFECVMVRSAALVKPDYSKSTGLYIQYFLQSSIGQNQIFTSMNQGAQPNLFLNHIQGLRIVLPSLSEQTAIATALSDADALISSLEKLIAKKRNIKQGAMQKLLEPKEGWGFQAVKALATITTGSKNTQDRIDGGVYPFFVRSQTVERINSYSFDGEAILVAGDGVGTGKVMHYIIGKFDFHQRVYKISDFRNGILGFYFFLYFKNNFLNRVMQMTAKSSVDSVRMDMIADMTIPFPSPSEQTRIATILSDMETEINALETKLEKYRNVKLGMMQNLLTGKIRLI